MKQALGLGRVLFAFGVATLAGCGNGSGPVGPVDGADVDMKLASAADLTPSTSCATAIDCAGVCGGPGVMSQGQCCASGKVDCNGVCDGPGMLTTGGCCADGRLDCNGVCDGPGVTRDGKCCASGRFDCAGVCDGPGVPSQGQCCASGKVDCSGVCDGPGVPSQGQCCASGKIDCHGVCDGPGVPNQGHCCASGKVDCRGVCDGPGVPANGHCCVDGKVDCAGVCHGPGVIDKGQCCASGNFDCAGVCDGPGVRDGQRCCPTGTCPPATCSDGYKDGSESDVDCGGDCFVACAAGQKCSRASDCAGIAECSGGLCGAPTSMVMAALNFASVGGLARNPVNGTVYASIAIGDLAFGGEIVAFAPGRRSIDWWLKVGGSPGALDVSADGTTLYVANTVAPFNVVQVDLPSRSVTRSFTLGTDPNWGAWVATELRVMPGDARTVGVVGRWPNNSASPGVHLFRDGVELYPGASIMSWQTNSKYLLGATSFAFADSQTLYAFDGTNDGFSLGTVAIGPTSLFVQQAPAHVIAGSFGDHIVFAGGKLFVTSGQTLDAGSHVLGAFGVQGAQAQVAIAPDAGRVYFLRGSTWNTPATQYAVDCFDPRTFTRSGGFNVDPSAATPRKVLDAAAIVPWGTAGLALWLHDAPDAPDKIVLMTDILDRVHGCAARTTAPQLYPEILAPDTTSVDGAVRAYRLDVKRIVANPASGSVYASVYWTDPRQPNRLVAFAPGSSGVAWSAYVGSNPGPLSVSDSGKTAWVGLSGAPTLTAVDVGSHLVASSFALPRGWADEYAIEIHAVPGSEQSVAASGKPLNTGSDGLFFFDNGQMRYPFPSGDLWGLRAFVFGDAQTVYTSHNGFLTLHAGPTSVERVSVVSTLDLGPSAEPQIAGGLVFTADGKVVDPVAGKLLGTCPRPPMFSSSNNDDTQNSFTVSRDGSRFYAAFSPRSNWWDPPSLNPVVECYDTKTFTKTGSIPFTIPQALDPNEVALYGDRGLAVRVGGTVVILPTALSTPGCEPHP
jgi:hypothetical protein